MLATFVIGLREGLEAALIVGIIAAFLRKNGRSLTAMWVGVALAVLLSIAVGVALDIVEKALPQAAQEGMETVIGAIAVFFVTGMIVWMHQHARDLKRQIEAEAAEALGQASLYALALMAFLSVLREGFETSVFLLATFSAAQSAALAAVGAVVGLLLAILIGWGIYAGGVRINLSRFFRITGAFLILVAAGLVIMSLRTAHEAGWLNAGQQMTIDLSWLVTPGSVQSALITGVLGIPADPRLIEVLGWLAYLIPVSLYVYWPHARRPGPFAAGLLKLAIAAFLAVVAAGLAVFYPASSPSLPAQVPLVSMSKVARSPDGTVGTAELRKTDGGMALRIAINDTPEAEVPLPAKAARQDRHEGLDASKWAIDDPGAPANAPSTLTLDEVVALSGGRIPVGLSPSRNPGPFSAKWSGNSTTSVWVSHGVLLDAERRRTTVVTLSGGGLLGPRTLTARDAGADAADIGWQVAADYRERAQTELHSLVSARTERALWAIQLPLALALIALLLAASGGRALMRGRPAVGTAPVSGPKDGRRADDPITKGVTHAAQ
jgi:high-affinity iron transporter